MTKNILSIIILVLFTTAFFSCDRELDSPPLGKIDESKILTIADIYKIHADSGDNYVFTGDYMLYGNIIMDDASGNIYKEAYLQDTSGGVNLYNLGYADATQVGSFVRINLNNSVIKEYRGKMEIDFTNIDDFRKRIVILKANDPITPAEVTIDDILSGVYDCELVKINDVQFVDTTATYYYEAAGTYNAANRELENCNGQQIIVRSSSYADFAKNKVASGKGSITGVITKFTSATSTSVTWQLLIRNINEVNMSEKRCSNSE